MLEDKFKWNKCPLWTVLKSPTEVELKIQKKIQFKSCLNFKGVETFGKKISSIHQKSFLTWSSIM
jgi:hypothetical protein